MHKNYWLYYLVKNGYSNGSVFGYKSNEEKLQCMSQLDKGGWHIIITTSDFTIYSIIRDGKYYWFTLVRED